MFEQNFGYDLAPSPNHIHDMDSIGFLSHHAMDPEDVEVYFTVINISTSCKTIFTRGEHQNRICSVN